MKCLVLNSERIAKESEARSERFTKEQDTEQSETEMERKTLPNRKSMKRSQDQEKFLDSDCCVRYKTAVVPIRLA